MQAREREIMWSGLQLMSNFVWAVNLIYSIKDPWLRAHHVFAWHTQTASAHVTTAAAKGKVESLDNKPFS